MEAFIALLVFAVFFYVMMRFGCGAHVIHGDQSDHNKKNDKRTSEKPVGRDDDKVTGGNVLLHSSTHWDDAKSQSTLGDGRRSDSHHY